MYLVTSHREGLGPVNCVSYLFSLYLNEQFETDFCKTKCFIKFNKIHIHKTKIMLSQYISWLERIKYVQLRTGSFQRDSEDSDRQHVSLFTDRLIKKAFSAAADIRRSENRPIRELHTLLPCRTFKCAPLLGFSHSLQVFLALHLVAVRGTAAVFTAASYTPDSD